MLARRCLRAISARCAPAGRAASTASAPAPSTSSAPAPSTPAPSTPAQSTSSTSPARAQPPPAQPDQAPPAPPDPDLAGPFRRLLRNMPSPVAVVTACDAASGERRGITVSSLTSVSLHPPIVAFCSHHPSRMGALVGRAHRFAAHLLARDQRHLALEFSTPHDAPADDPFRHVAFYVHPDSLQPVLIGTLGALVCDVVGAHHVGDHALWLGRVTAVEEGLRAPGSRPEPLLYYHRQYHGVGETVFLDAFEDRTLAFGKWTHKAHVRMAWSYLREHGRDEGTRRIRVGIQRYNERNKDQIVIGYHETTTLFFVHLIWLALQTAPEIEDFAAFLDTHAYLGRYGVVFQFYSKEHLFQPRAATEWVEPDLRPLPASQLDVLRAVSPSP